MTRSESWRSKAVASIGVLLMLAVASRASASTVVTMNVARMGDLAAQVIVADIGEATTAWAENPRRIETTVELRNIEYLKGAYPGAPTQRTLVVPGGKIGDKRMRICCAPEFETGQRWVLFLLPTYKTFPTVGLGQGAFRIIEDTAGVAHVFQHGGLPIAGLDAETGLTYSIQPPAHVHGQLAGAPTHLRIVDRSTTPTAERMTLDAFRAAILPILDNSKNHALKQPAGARVPVVYRPVPIVRSSTAEPAAIVDQPTRRMRRPREATPIRPRGVHDEDEEADVNKASEPSAPAASKNRGKTPDSKQGGDR